MIDALPDWNNPTPQMLAGVKLARLCSERGGMNETTFAEWVIGARASLWYLQALEWSDDPPALLTDPRARQFFQAGMQAVVRIVDYGYDDADGRWWPLDKVWPDQGERDAATLVMMDAASLLERMKDVPIWPKDIPREYAQPGFLAVSAGFWPFFSTVLGPRWRQRYLSMIAAMREARRITFEGRKGIRRDR
jgi:hypothetical protein